MASWPGFDNMNALGENLGVFLGSFFQSFVCSHRIWEYLKKVPRCSKTAHNTARNRWGSWKPKPMCIAKKKLGGCFQILLHVFVHCCEKMYPCWQPKLRPFHPWNSCFSVFFHQPSFPAGAWIRGIDWIQTEKMESGEALWEVGELKKKTLGCWLMMCSPPHEKPKMTCFPNKIWLKWSRMARWWRKSLDVFSFPYLFLTFNFSWLDLYPSSSLPKPPVFVIRVPFERLTVLQRTKCQFQDFRLQHSPKNPSSFPAMRGLPTTMQRDMGKVGFFGFSLGNLEHFIFFGMLTLVDRIEFSVALAEIREYTPFLRTIDWLAGCLRKNQRFWSYYSGFNQHTLAWNHQVLRGFSATPHFGE